MKHSTEELLLAAKVRDLAVGLRQAEWQRAADAVLRAAVEPLGPAPDRMAKEWEGWDAQSEAARDAARAAWHKERPATTYVEEALNLISACADVIVAKRI